MVIKLAIKLPPGRGLSEAPGGLEGNQRRIQKRSGRRAWQRRRAGPELRAVHADSQLGQNRPVAPKEAGAHFSARLESTGLISTLIEPSKN